MDYRLNVSMFLLGLVVVSILAEPSKRLLLHTEGDIVTRIAELEKQIADQSTKIADQNTKIADQNTKITDQNTEITALKTQLQTKNFYENAGDTYIRWGRTTCPGNVSTLVHAGYMGSTFILNHHSGGAGANYVYLPDKPTWNYFTSSKDNGISVTGIEYNFNPHLSSAYQQPFFGTYVGRSEAPCALCYVSRGTSVMIPRRTDCYSGWTEEYSGYLVGDYPGYAESTEYVCLDRRPDVVPHSGNADVENTLYFVEAHCGGTLACPPYVDGRELACVVCSI